MRFVCLGYIDEGQWDALSEAGQMPREQLLAAMGMFKRLEITD
jgi:hypothetical protein